MKKLNTLFFALLATFSSLNAQVVSTFAGSGALGYTNGTGTAASFWSPYGVAVDGSGNVYVGDDGNSLIRKITPAGVVTTLAGSGATGSANGTGTAASFNLPAGVAVDGSGNVYVVDRMNALIRKITPAGVVTTLAGGASGGVVKNGTGTAANFYGPFGIAVAASGNVYVAETYTNLIRKITPAGVVTTFAGKTIGGFANGTDTAARFDNPYGVAVDANENVYVADLGNDRIRKISPAGVVTTFAGSGTGGSANGMDTTASFLNPRGVAVDANGNIFVVDNNLIRKISPAGMVSYIAGGFAVGSANGIDTAARFNVPTSVAVDPSGNIYVADQRNNLIRKITMPATGVNELAGAGKSLTVYPNPTSNLLYLESNDFTQYEIMNLVGQCLQKGLVENRSISTSNLAGGVYVLHLANNESGSAVVKFVKE